MPTEALVHVAKRLCEAEVVEEYVLDDNGNYAVVQYLIIIAERSPALRVDS